MRHSIAFLVLAACGMLPPSGRERNAATTSCAAADAGSARLADFAREFVTSPAEGMAGLRSATGLAGISVTDVGLETDPHACGQAATALNALASTPSMARRLYVVKAGSSRWFVQDPTATGTHYNPVYIFDQRFRLIRVLAAL